MWLLYFLLDFLLAALARCELAAMVCTTRETFSCAQSGGWSVVDGLTGHAVIGVEQRLF
jgi:hypothetical protein